MLAYCAHGGIQSASRMIINHVEEYPMAKGQMRSNKETRKPKKDKSPIKAASSEGSQVKLAGSTTPIGKKK
jgi:hypothetical protein